MIFPGLSSPTGSDGRSRSVGSRRLARRAKAFLAFGIKNSRAKEHGQKTRAMSNAWDDVYSKLTRMAATKAIATTQYAILPTVLIMM